MFFKLKTASGSLPESVRRMDAVMRVVRITACQGAYSGA